ncbi:MAG: hypothetical protein IH933_01325 [Euryarchaeota archaeon]|jgi:hypothetical protein|nr:hypothetical protein [Euryarchaeota archaeon]
MTSGGVAPILVDTSALLAYCKTNYAELVFETLQMATTNVCNKEIGQQRRYTTDLIHEGACNKYYQLLRENRNPDQIFVESYKPHVEDQGESTLIEVFEDHPYDIDYILLFDFDAIERLEQVRKQIDATNTKISLPNYAFEILRRNSKMTDQDYCKATYQMAAEEGWLKDHALRIDSVSSVTCSQFP